ncbi:MAG: hypothetical protein IKQ94_02425 [Bacteroidales bacterium]|nr:hypothetical protein [Bacteroidales bacterium]
MKKLLFICTLFTIVMMTACRNWTANRNNDKLTLIGHWETVLGQEDWICDQSQEYEELIREGNTADSVIYSSFILDSAYYQYISFDIDEDSISMLMHDKGCDIVPPFEINKLTVGYSVDSSGIVTWYWPDGRIIPMWKIVELTADKLVFKEDYPFEDCEGTWTYTMRKR